MSAAIHHSAAAGAHPDHADTGPDQLTDAVGRQGHEIEQAGVEGIPRGGVGVVAVDLHRVGPGRVGRSGRPPAAGVRTAASSETTA